MKLSSLLSEARAAVKRTDIAKFTVEWFSSHLAACGNPACPRRKRVGPRYTRKSLGFLVEDRWFCGPGCAQDFLLFRVHSLLSSFRPTLPRTFRVPLGMLLVSRGTIDRQCLSKALLLQKAEAPRKLGEHLLALGAVTELQLTAALSQQWACPIFPLESQRSELLPFFVAPLEIFRASHSVPAHLSPDARSLHVAFCDLIDHTTLYAIASMLDCQTFPSVATASSVQSALDSRTAVPQRFEPCFDAVHDPRDISATLASFAVEVHATQLRMVRTQHHLWGRLFNKTFIRDVLFRIPDNLVAFPQSLSPAKESAPTADSRKERVSKDFPQM
jgi:hypothetical protein